MSSPSLPVIVSPRARVDFEEILLHSLITWGEEQAISDEATVDRVLGDLGRFPHLGRAQDEIAPSHRSYPVGEHIISYRLEENAVTIDRILHARMDPRGRLGP